MLQVTVDKFTFRIPESLLFSSEGVWVEVTGTQGKMGLSDFAQQVNGDVAFANVMPSGTVLAAGDEFGSIETVKVSVALSSPVAGEIIEINTELEDAPELINQDPYGKGWILRVEFNNPAEALSALLDAESYRDLVKVQAESELKK